MPEIPSWLSHFSEWCVMLNKYFFFVLNMILITESWGHSFGTIPPHVTHCVNQKASKHWFHYVTKLFYSLFMKVNMTVLNKNNGSTLLKYHTHTLGTVISLKQTFFLPGNIASWTKNYSEGFFSSYVCHF